MDELEEFKDDFLREIMQKGKQVMPNSDFEKELMVKIHAISTHKKEVHAALVLSFRFFLGALILGLGLLLSVLFEESLFEFSSKTLMLLALFTLGVIGILYGGNYRRIINLYRS